MKKWWLGVYVFGMCQLVYLSTALAQSGDVENLLEGSADWLSTKIIPAGGALGTAVGGGFAALGGRNGHEIATRAIVGTAVGTVGSSLIYAMVRFAR